MPRQLELEPRMTLGKNMAEAREHAGYSQSAAAKAAGLRRELINLWENGKQTPGAEGLLQMAVLYGCSVDQFLSGVDERYDDIIEGRLPVDALRHFRAKVSSFIRQGNTAIATMRDALAPVPTQSGTNEARVRARGKSGAARARQVRKK